MCLLLGQLFQAGKSLIEFMYEVTLCKEGGLHIILEADANSNGIYHAFKANFDRFLLELQPKSMLVDCSEYIQFRNEPRTMELLIPEVNKIHGLARCVLVNPVGRELLCDWMSIKLFR